jgi:RNA polymerase sigma-70 factor (ECF subfamily)
MPISGDDILLDRALAGDQSALGDLLQTHQSRIFNTVLRMVGNRDDAEELTQDVMVKIVQHVSEYNGHARFSTWVTRIAMNQSISHLRKRRLRRTISLDAPARSSDKSDRGSALAEQLQHDGNQTPDQCVEMGEMTEHLQDAMDRLDDDFRSVLVLRDINEMDYQQIAQSLDVPVGTVKSRLFRARLALRAELSKLYPSIAGSASAEAARGVADG